MDMKSNNKSFLSYSTLIPLSLVGYKKNKALKQSRTGIMCIFKQYSWNVCYLFCKTSNCASVFIVAVRETAEDFKKALKNKYDLLFFSSLFTEK